MKKLFFLLCMLMSLTISTYAQHTTVTFWTANGNYGNIKVYVNGNYEGTITRYYSSAPSCGAAGCVTVIITRRSGNTWYAEAEDGSTWSSDPVRLTGSCTTMKLYGTPNYRRAGGTSSGGTGRGGSGSDSSGPWDWDYGDNVLAAAVLMASVTAVVGTVYMSNDVYVNWVTSQNYGGFNFGLKNTINRHLDFEIGAGIYAPHDTYKAPSGIFGVDYPYQLSNFTTFDLNAVYNFLGRSFGFGRSFTLSPYVGLGFSVLFSEQQDRGGYYNRGVSYNYFGVGGIAGFSAGFWENRIQLHARYKWITDFNHPTVLGEPAKLASQFELGLSVKYKYGWGFNIQHFDDLEYDEYNDPTIRFGIQAGFSTPSTIKIGNGYECESRTGYNLMLYMTGKVSNSWAINWGMIGFNSRGFKTGYNQFNFSYIPMSLNVSWEFDAVPEWEISLLPFAGLQLGFLTTGKTYDFQAAVSEKIDYKTSLNTFNIGPSVGFGIRIFETFEIGMQYDYGLMNMFKQKDESSLKGANYYLRDLQIYTRVFF